VIAEFESRLEVRSAGRERRRRHPPIISHAGFRGFPGGQSGGVTERPAYGNLCFALLCELGPIVGDRPVEVESPLLDEDVGARRKNSLPYRLNANDGVLAPRVGPRIVEVTTPKVDGEATVYVDRDGRPKFNAHICLIAVETLGESLPQAFKTRV
jgi:hypothetical protein